MQLRKPIQYNNISIKKVVPRTCARGKVLWVHGHPCSGKTFQMDYLETLGWHPIDGDAPAYSKDPMEAKAFGDALQANFWEQKGKPFDPAHKEWFK